MSAFMPPWSSWSPGRSRGVPDPQMRVSDAERSQVSETLSKHYSEGRLDEAEFNERLHKAMSAKTRGDLSGLLVDLPPVAAATPVVATRRHRGRFGLLVIAVFLFFMALSSPVWAWRWGIWHFPWLLVAIVFFVIWRISHAGRGHYHRHYGPGGSRRGEWM
jgi:hypothetical protein